MLNDFLLQGLAGAPAVTSHPDSSRETAAARKLAQAERASREADYLEDRLDRLLLVTRAMWELIRDKTSLNEDDLLAKVQEIDLRDGVADGKVTQTVMKCPACGRTMSPKHKKCLYCGAQSLAKEAFDAAM